MVDNVSGVGGMGNLQPKRGVRSPYRFEAMPEAADTVDLSAEVMRLSVVDGTVKMDKVMAVREKIAAGGYFTDKKLSFALDLAMDEALKSL